MVTNASDATATKAEDANPATADGKTKAREPRPGGTITDEGIARLRARIGIAEPHTAPPQYRRPNVDAFRNVARCYGDDNPLWCDEDYATASSWGGPIAHPRSSAATPSSARTRSPAFRATSGT